MQRFGLSSLKIVQTRPKRDVVVLLLNVLHPQFRIAIGEVKEAKIYKNF